MTTAHTSAEGLAALVADLRSGNVTEFDRESEHKDWVNSVVGSMRELAVLGPLVDATPIYSALDAAAGVNPYDEYPEVVPPWEYAVIGWRNAVGLDLALACFTADLTKDTQMKNPALMWESEENELDWSRVRWVVWAWLYLKGGLFTKLPPSAWGHRLTLGPVNLFRIAIYEDGSPADIHWAEMTPLRPGGRLMSDVFADSVVVLMAVMNFMACRNVDIVEPVRDRGTRRRLKRIGVERVHQIVITPKGKTYRRSAEGAIVGAADGELLPLTAVRGHFAHYGPKYGRGLLFGKLEGRFWIPAFARGSVLAGVSEHDYLITREDEGGMAPDDSGAVSNG